MARPAPDEPGEPLRRDDLPTLAAAGVLAATLAALAHETLGHGGACLLRSGQVTLLTSLFFRCRGGGDLVDAAGPAGGLLCGAAALALLRLRGLAAIGRVFLLSLASSTLFWTFGQLARDSLAGVDDWAFLARAVGGGAPAAVGVAGYVAVARGLALDARSVAAAAAPETRRRLLAPFLAGAVSAVLAGALWAGHRGLGAREGLLTLGLAPLGWLWVVGSAARRAGPQSGAPEPITRDWRWIATAVAVFAAFAAVQGRGIGPLA